MNYPRLAVAALLAAALIGCGPGGGILLTPVATDQTLEEKTVGPEPGWATITVTDTGRGLVAGVCVAFIAMISDRLISAWSTLRKKQLGLI